MKDFISFQDGFMKTICHVYKHEDGRILHLLPVIHVGEEEYYEALLGYIGEKICVYESIIIKSENTESVELNSFDEWLQYNEKIAEEIDTTLGPEIKKFQRNKIIDRFIRRLRRLVKRNLGVADERLTTFFNQLERTNFSLHNHTIQQILLAEFLNVTYQFNAIDYINDIPHRKNWIHGDIDIELPEPSRERTIDILKHPPPGFVEIIKANARQFYGLLYLVESLVHGSINERRTQMAQLFSGMEQEEIPGEYIDGRNNIVIETASKQFDEHDEVVIFYGAAHMDGIKVEAEKVGFELISTHEFLAFGLVEDVETEKKPEPTNTKFITHGEEDDYLKTVCHVYNREDGKTIHLLPKFHYAEKRYYEELLNYIDNVKGPCIYQKPFLSKTVKSFQECFEIGESVSEKFQQTHTKEQLRRFYKVFFNKDIQDIQKTVKKVLKNIDKRIVRMYDHIELSGFRPELLNEMHAFMSEKLELSFEMFEIDYINDISSHTNWKTSELRIDSIPDDFNIEDIVLAENESQLAVLRLYALVLYMNLYILAFSNDIEELEDRLYEIGDSLWNVDDDENDVMFISPNNHLLDIMVQELESNDDVVIFYDMWYMPEIEQGLIGLNFQHQSEKEFNLFFMHSDVDEDEEDE
ncbi:MAG: hypothetical protein ACTSRE_01265 [Promethearchaeota archaeon]